MARKKSINDITEQYLRITQYLATRPSGDHSGMQARAQRALNTYLGNIYNSKQFERDNRRRNKIYGNYKKYRAANQMVNNRKYSQRTYMGAANG